MFERGVWMGWDRFVTIISVSVSVSAVLSNVRVRRRETNPESGLDQQLFQPLNTLQSPDIEQKIIHISSQPLSHCCVSSIRADFTRIFWRQVANYWPKKRKEADNELVFPCSGFGRLRCNRQWVGLVLYTKNTAASLKWLLGRLLIKEEKRHHKILC